MKKIKVSIKDENTLVLLEDADQGDIIDLKSLHDVDIDKTTITHVVNSIKRDKFDEEVRKETQRIEKENEYKLKLREQELAEKAKEDLRKQENTIRELHLELKNIAEKAEREKEITLLKEKQKIAEEYQKELKLREQELSKIKSEKELSEQIYKEKLSASETALVNYKEMKTRMSTKMIGESLELHCENEFNRIRSIAFPNAQFAKDNDISQ